MRNKIYAIIIDSKRTYNNLIQKELLDTCEKEIEVKSLRSDNELCGSYMDHVDAIVTIGKSKENYNYLLTFGEDIQTKWYHSDAELSEENLIKVIIEIFKNNIKNWPYNNLFSIITPTYNSTLKELERLYYSLKNQSYPNWDWWVLDDSNGTDVVEMLQGFDDTRIHIFKKYSHNGNIGYNKGILGCMCSGNYIVEVDDDDELTPDCLEILSKAFRKFPDAGFAYSNTLELMPFGEQNYGERWGYNHGGVITEQVKGEPKIIMDTPNINCETLRACWTCPNHIRVWRRDIYDKLRGHNRNLSIADDYELTLRTFLNTRIIKIQKTLYIQHHEQITESYIRQNEISRCYRYILEVWDKDLHVKIPTIDNNDDLIWDEEKQKGIVSGQFSYIKPLNYIYKP